MKKLKTFASVAALTAAAGTANAAVLDIQVDIFAQDTNAVSDAVALPAGTTQGDLVDMTADGGAYTRTVGGTLDTVTGEVHIAGVNGWVDNWQAVTGFDDLANLDSSYSSSGSGVYGAGLLNVTGWQTDTGTGYCTDLSGTICNYLGVGTAGSGTGTLPASAPTITGLWAFNDGWNVGSTASVSETDTTNGRNYTGTITFTILDSPLLPAPIPIPAAAWLFGSALLGLGGIARRRRQS